MFQTTNYIYYIYIYIQRLYLSAPRLRHGPRWCYLHRGHVSRCPQLRLGSESSGEKHPNLVFDYHDSIFFSYSFGGSSSFCPSSFVSHFNRKFWGIPHCFGQTQVNLYVRQIHAILIVSSHSMPLQ